MIRKSQLITQAHYFLSVVRWHTLRTTKLELGIDARSMRKIAVERELITAEQMHLRDNNVMLPAAKVEELAKVYQNAVDLQYVKAKLGILELTARTLVREGLLRPVIGSAREMKAKFAKSDVDGLLNKIAVGLPESQNEAELLSLVDAARKGGGSVANVITVLVAGKLKTRYLSTDPQRVGLMRILLDPREVRNEFAFVGGIKRQDFTKAFPFRPLEADKLFYSEFFERVREVSPTNHVRYDAVTKASFDSFRREHITLAKLAVGWARPVEVKRILDAAEVLPVWQIEGRRALTFYRKKDVEAYRPRST